ncbi:MAG TPA: DNA ligase D [Verrucomicrobiae bacterium]|jgi:bifunctional non-homologous end joining protein LigD|nr:DNA ligase D [Verrucomicrobiae bacterium]
MRSDPSRKLGIGTRLDRRRSNAQSIRNWKKTLASLRGAVGAKLPAFIPPELTTLVDDVPAGDAWLHEIKFDGYRALCRLKEGKAQFFTREGNDWSARFAALAEPAAALAVREAFLDGEVVALEKNGASNFQRLQEALSAGEGARLVYYVFDLLYLDGYDLREVPLHSRKGLLADLLKHRGKSGRLRYSDHVIGHAEEFFRRARDTGLEGIVSKRKESPYRAGRARDWLKIKCHASQEFVLGGFTEPSGSRIGLGALLLGHNNDRHELIYAGKVGTGFNSRSLTDLRRRLEKIETAKPPFANPPRLPRREGVHWIEPRYAAEIEFTGWTRDGLLRHPSFKGLREDKPPAKISRERPEPVPENPAPRRSTDTAVAGVALSNPERVLYAEQGITKIELARYYEEISDWILPHISLRPLTMVRCPEGYRKCFYQKHVEENLPPSFKRIFVKEKRASGRYVMIDSLPGLISLVQMGVLEIHTWGSRAEHVEQPDQLIFDLDPDAGLPWNRVVEAARRLRVRLRELGLESFVKTTGGKGLHVVVPIVPEERWDAVKEFTKQVAESIAREAPESYLTKMSKAKRAGKIFIDYLRNGRGATAVAAYSTRARSGAPVSVPLRWEELADGVRPDQYNVRNIRRRLTALRKDPWHDFAAARRSIRNAMRRVREVA